MKILALDCSTKSTGYALFEDNKLTEYGVLTAKSKDVFERIKSITNQIEILLRRYEPDEIIAEEVLPPEKSETSFIINNKTFKALIYLQASIATLIHNTTFKKISITFIYPGTWRANLGIKTGRGIRREAIKKETMIYINDKFGLDIKIDDISDAIGIGSSVIDKTNELNWE